MNWKALEFYCKHGNENSSTPVLFNNIGDFKDLLNLLIEPLVEKGEFSRSQEEGYWGILRMPYTGIEAYDKRSTGPWEGYPEEKVYYPKREIDVKEYLQHVGLIHRNGLRPFYLEK